MDVATAVTHRKSVRAFLPTPVADDTIRELLTLASRSPSGGNVQPWRIYVVNGEATPALIAHAAQREPAPVEYEIYPANLWEPYRTNRFALGEAMYATIGIAREDKEGRLRQFGRNAELFGAPVGVFCFIDRGMGPPQWADLGMFLQTFMLLAEDAGLSTCAQEFWSVHHQAVQEFFNAPDNEMLFCGMAVGYADLDNPINTLESERMPLDAWAKFVTTPPNNANQ